MVLAKRGDKSRAILAYLAANPNAGPAQIVAGIREQGTVVSFGLARAVKYRKRKRKVSAGRSVMRSAATGKPVTDKPITGSEMIRQYIARHPEQKPTAIALGLKQEGVDVSMALIGRVKYAKNTKSKKRRKAAAPVMHAAARMTVSTDLTVVQLLAVKEFASTVGGADRLREALDMLDQLK